MKPYIPNTPLGENEYLLKIYKGNHHRGIPFNTGYMTKLTQKGEMPKPFKEWYDVPVYVVEETFQSGWILVSHRFGESQNWAVLLHPLEFTIEIHLTNFLELCQEITVTGGILLGRFKFNPQTKRLEKE